LHNPQSMIFLTLVPVNKSAKFYIYKKKNIFLGPDLALSRTGWAGINSPNPARFPFCFHFFLPAGVRELLTHACYRNMVIKMQTKAYLLLHSKMKMTVMEGWPAEMFSSPLFSFRSSPGLLPVLSFSLLRSPIFLLTLLVFFSC